MTCQAHPVLVKKANQVCGSFLLIFFLSRWLSSLSIVRSGPPVDGPKDPWPHVLSLPERFVGDPASLARDNILDKILVGFYYNANSMQYQNDCLNETKY